MLVKAKIRKRKKVAKSLRCERDINRTGRLTSERVGPVVDDGEELDGVAVLLDHPSRVVVMETHAAPVRAVPLVRYLQAARAHV